MQIKIIIFLTVHYIIIMQVIITHIIMFKNYSFSIDRWSQNVAGKQRGVVRIA